MSCAETVVDDCLLVLEVRLVLLVIVDDEDVVKEGVIVTVTAFDRVTVAVVIETARDVSLAADMVTVVVCVRFLVSSA